MTSPLRRLPSPGWVYAGVFRPPRYRGAHPPVTQRELRYSSVGVTVKSALLHPLTGTFSSGEELCVPLAAQLCEVGETD